MDAVVGGMVVAVVVVVVVVVSVVVVSVVVVSVMVVSDVVVAVVIVGVVDEQLGFVQNSYPFTSSRLRFSQVTNSAIYRSFCFIQNIFCAIRILPKIGAGPRAANVTIKALYICVAYVMTIYWRI